MKGYFPAKDFRSDHERIVLLLAEGHGVAKVADLLHFSQDKVYKVKKKALEKGFLRFVYGSFPHKFEQGPFFKNQIGNIFSDSLKTPGRPKRTKAHASKTPRTNVEIPHHFRVTATIGSPSFLEKLKPSLKKIKQGRRFSWKEEGADYTAIWTEQTLTLWILSDAFGKDLDVRGQIKFGFDYAGMLIKGWNANGAKLRLATLHENIEWTIANRQLSDAVQNFLELADFEQVLIGDTRLAAKDSTDDFVELNKAAGHPDAAATNRTAIFQTVTNKAFLEAHYQLLSENEAQKDEIQTLKRLVAQLDLQVRPVGIQIQSLQNQLSDLKGEMRR